MALPGRYCTGVCLEELRKSYDKSVSLNIVFVPAETRTGHLPNVNQKHFRLTSSTPEVLELQRVEDHERTVTVKTMYRTHCASV